MQRLSKKRAPKLGPVDHGTGTVRRGLCIKCGHDLHGRLVSHDCPACGHSIYDSVFGGFLIDQSPDEPKRIHGVSNIVFYPLLLLGALTILGVLVTLLGAGADFVKAVDEVFQVGLAVAMIVPVIALTGVIVFTGRHTIEYYRHKYANPAYIAGAAGALLALLILLGIAAVQFGFVASAVIQVAFVTIPTAAFIQRVGHLMRRIPNKKLANRADLLFVVTCSLGLAALATCLLRQTQITDANLRGFVVLLTLATDVGALSLGALTLRLLIFARRTLLAITPLEASAAADQAAQDLATDAAAEPPAAPEPAPPKPAPPEPVPTAGDSVEEEEEPFLRI